MLEVLARLQGSVMQATIVQAELNQLIRMFALKDTNAPQDLVRQPLALYQNTRTAKAKVHAKVALPDTIALKHS